MRNLEVAMILRARDEASRTVGRAMQNLAQSSQGAEKSITRMQRESRRLAQAREALGVRSEREIQREIARTEAAYQRLANAGGISAREQGRAYAAARERVRELRQELGEVGRMQRGLQTGARGLRGMASVAAGVAAGTYVAAQPIKRTMDYDRRLAAMANTAYSERDAAGRVAGARELDSAIRSAVRQGGGTRDAAAETLDNLLASGAVSQQSAFRLLPTLQKYATASGADPNALGNIALTAMRNFKIPEAEIPRALDMALKSGQAGGFEIRDMAKWLPQQMAAARGMSGLGDFATLLTANQASVTTAGTKDEAGNNLVNLLAKINSNDTKRDAQRIGIDLTGSLVRARGKGVNPLDAFVGVVDHEVGKDKRYQALRKQADAAPEGSTRAAALESMGDMLQASSIGKLIQDRQALMALVAYMNNRDQWRDVRAKTTDARNEGNTSFDVIRQTASYQSERLANEKSFAEQEAFTGLSHVVGDAAGKLADYAAKYPGLSAAVTAATTAISALAAAAAASGLVNLLTAAAAGKGLAAAAGARAAAASGAAVAEGSAVAAGGAAAGAGSGWLRWIAGKVPALGAFSMAAAPLATMRGVTNWAGDTSHDQERTSTLLNLSHWLASILPGRDFDAARRKSREGLDTSDEVRTPKEIKVTVDVQNGNIVAAVNAANANAGRRY